MTIPALSQPADGAVLSSFAPTLQWTNPLGATQFQLQVLPANGDGPGVDLITNAGANSIQIPAPPQWYGLLPDMTYTWRIRATSALTALTGVSGAWGPWAERRFHTPAVSSATITLSTPKTSASPVLQWANTRTDVYYYEVQLSRDSSFNTDPRTATTAVYSSLIHGGVTNNSYQAPQLEAGATYYWRVRPRVQGDGTPVSWSRTTSFTAPAPSAGSTLEQQALGLINDIRTANGLASLSQSSELTQAANLHSEDMAGTGVMSHSGSDGSDPGQRITAAGYTWRVYGEIVAAGYQSAKAVVDAWMNSPPHREVILLPEVREFGGGLVQSKDGRSFWTVDFGLR